MLNGLLLCPNHDSLFDKGYISFEDNGKVIISNEISINDANISNVNSNMGISVLEGQQKYLSWHRNNILRKF